MSPDHPAAMTARAIVRALVAAGVTDVVVAPGSRSAPLAYALHAAEQAGWLRLAVSVDERSAGFLALGIARLRPAAVVTTSGTAVANLHPAVLEASHSDLPLVLLTADRPHELRGVGANQTTDQVGLFGRAVRWFGEIPAASTSADSHLGVGAAVTRAVVSARGARSAHPGPVHLNVAFRDPLTPASRWVPSTVPSAAVRVADTYAEPVPSLLTRGPRTVIVAGDGTDPLGQDLVASSGWPVLAEPSSGLRGSDTAIAGYRALLDVMGGDIERVVVLGRPTLSRPIHALLARGDVHTVVAAPGPQWVDVTGTADLVTGAVTVLGGPDPAEQRWVQRWLESSRAVSSALAEEFDGAALTGPEVARAALSREQVAAALVVLGSSMAIRDADLAAGVGAGFTTQPVVANRGLSGIDGTISTATGLALATGGPVRAVIGDLTFQHDVGGLARGEREPEVDLQVIVLNDDGGSIFATLEHGEPENAEIYPRMFGTPQGLDIAALAAGFGAGYQQVTSSAELAAALARPIQGRSVVEVPIEASTARERSADLYALVREAARTVSR